MRQFGLFLQGLFSPKPYLAALEGRLGAGRIILFEYCLGILLLACALLAFVWAGSRDLAPQLERLPPLQIAQGQLVTQMAEPATLTLFNVPFLTIDPARTVDAVQAAPAPAVNGAYLLRDGFVMFKRGEVRLRKFEPSVNRTVTLQDVRALLPKVLGILLLFSPLWAAIMLPIFFAVGFVSFLYCLLIGGVLNAAFAKPVKPGKIFAFAFLLLFYGTVWGILLRSFLPVLPGWAWYGLLGALLAAGIYAYRARRPALLEAMPPAP